MKYGQIISGEPFVIDPSKEILHVACCECGLVHSIDVEIVKRKVHMTWKLKPRATGQIRRGRKNETKIFRT